MKTWSLWLLTYVPLVRNLKAFKERLFSSVAAPVVEITPDDFERAFHSRPAKGETRAVIRTTRGFRRYRFVDVTPTMLHFI